MGFDGSMTGVEPEILLEPWLISSSQIDSGASSSKVVSEMRVDSDHYFALLVLDLVEHQRRQLAGVGHASTRLLHVLWGFPARIQFPTSACDSYEIETLRAESEGWIHVAGTSFTRVYQPIGRIDMVAVVDESLKKAVSRAAAHPATTRRLAIWSRQGNHTRQSSSEDLAEAARLGIGVIATGQSEPTALIGPAPAVIGRPAVYRWWQAEACYRNWLSSTGPTGTTVNVDSPPW
jgi:hypothetical protein